MAKWTMTLQEILASGYNIWHGVDYPFVAGHREEFERKFVDTYMYHEINFISADKFRQRLGSLLRNKMPLYLQRYRSEMLIKNPMVNFSQLETFKRSEDKEVVKRLTEVANEDSIVDTRGAGRVDSRNQMDGTTDSVGREDRDGRGTVATATHNNMDRTENETTVTDRRLDRTQRTTDDGTRELDSTATRNLTGVVNSVSREVVADNSRADTSFSDTPQTPLGNIAAGGTGTEGAIGDYLTTFTRVQNSGTKTTDTTSTVNTTENEVTNTQENEVTHNTQNITEGISERTNTERNLTANQVDNGTVNTNTTDILGIDNTLGVVAHQLDVGKQELSESSNEIARNRKSSGSTGEDNLLGTVLSHRHNQGISGISESELLTLYRDTFINVDEELIDEMNILFLGVYGYENDEPLPLRDLQPMFWRQP